MGVVHRAEDRETGTEVAVKTLLVWDPTDLYLLKQEFRSLAELSHPNLVELYELFTGQETCFFTMELVIGASFVDYLRPDGFDQARFAATTAQLVRALETLHGAGKLHRDVKPSNVLVTPAGRVVVLDFGLSTVFRGAGAGDTTTGLVVGTPAYMAPEQAMGAPPAPPADWYAVGVMLYQAVAGRLPFAGTFSESFQAKATGLREWPDDIADLSPPVRQLILALLSPDPARRPSAAQVLDLLTTGTPRERSFVSTLGQDADDEIHVDRERELAALEANLRESRNRALATRVKGVSGIGKTAIVRRFLRDTAQPAGALILSGRCDPQETVPYRGFDAVVDELSRFLLEMPAEETRGLAPRHASALTRIFPVLARVPAFDDPSPVDAGAEPHELRRRGFIALRELLARIAERRPLVVWVDDAQWGGEDSAALLRELVRAPDAPRALLLLSYRDEAGERAPLVAACSREDLAHSDLPVGPLDAAAACALVRTFASADADAEGLAAEAGGSPFLISQLGRLDAVRPSVRLRDILDDRVRRLSNEARNILEIVSVAASPIERSVALEAAGCGEAGRLLVVALQRDRLLRAVGASHAAVEAYHDRVREAVTTTLDPTALALRHRALARAFETRGVAEPDRMAAHLSAAGELEQASVWAVIAGDRAAEALAFVRAAQFYRRAREWWPGDRARERDLEVREADALVNAGRCAEAGSLFLRASEKADAVVALDLRRRAAEQFLAGGRVDDGVKVLEPLLNGMRLPFPRTPQNATVRAVARLLQLRIRGTALRPRGPDISRHEMVGVDVCYSAAKSFSIVDPTRSVYFSLATLLLALRLGEPTRVARSLLMVGATLRSLGSGALVRWGERMMRQAGDLAPPGDPYLAGFTAAVMGSVHVVRGEWSQALEQADYGVRLLNDRCRGVSFDVAIGRMAALRALEELGRLDEVGARAEEMLAVARDTGDFYAEVTASLYSAFAAIAAGRPEDARSLASEARARWTRHDFHIQHLYTLRIAVFCDLYDHRPDAAWTQVDAVWPDVVRSGLLRVPVSRVDALLLRARSALATRDVARLRSCEADTARLAREARSDARAHAASLRAGIVALRGDAQSAARLAEVAAAAYRSANMPLHALCAERRRAEHGAKTGELSAIDARIRECGVTDPARWADVYAPGFRTAATAE